MSFFKIILLIIMLLNLNGKDVEVTMLCSNFIADEEGSSGRFYGVFIIQNNSKKKIGFSAIQNKYGVFNVFNALSFMIFSTNNKWKYLDYLRGGIGLLYAEIPAGKFIVLKGFVDIKRKPEQNDKIKIILTDNIFFEGIWLNSFEGTWLNSFK